MPFNVVYALLAILGLGFLVFIHELGHYWVARRKGMRVEAFSIGFGKAMYAWERDGVKWQIGWLPFGGYVRIAGMQKEGSREPYEITDGFYGKRPWDRIQVALAGPVVNIAFAFAVFVGLWILGGREKSFSEFTHRIGWVDPKSALYEQGVRPGDVIVKYDDRLFNGFKDLMVSSVMNHDTTRIQGYKINYANGKRSQFDYTLKNYEDPRSARDKFHTIGVVSPAQYLIYQEAGTPSTLKGSGIEASDRILWADGEIIFSVQQLSTLINESTVFLTVARGSEVFHTKVPRVRLDDLKLKAFERGELDDWQHEAGLKGRLSDLYFIPYSLSPTGSVESRLSFIDEQDQTRAFQKCERCSYFNPLQEGDQILAIEGTPVQSSYDLLQQLQTRHVLVIVERDLADVQKVLWTKADGQFDDFSIAGLDALVASIGMGKGEGALGNLRLLKPIVPQPALEIYSSEAQREHNALQIAEAKKKIQEIEDPEQRAEAMSQLEKSQKKLVLGMQLKDRPVIYNPNPIQQFGNVFSDTWRTLSGLFSGGLNPKYMSGPVGIVHIVHQSWMIGVKEALFWMAVISLNLGFINLLPIPVLDGGHIVFSIFEAITRRRLKSQTMERLIIPFVGLMIGLFLYITYQDITRLFSKFF